MIKLVVTDMDGTLLDRNANISKKNYDAIKRLEENNIEFAIASGRDYQGVYSIVHSLNIECEAILGNGAQYVDRNGNLLMSCYMNKGFIKDIVKIFEDAHIPYMIFTNHGFYTGQDPKWVRDTFVERGYRRFNTPYHMYDKGGKNEKAPCNQLVKIDNYDEFLTRDIEIIKVEAFSLDSSEIAPTKELLKNIPTISYLSSFDDNVEVTDQFAQKGLILEKVIELKGLTKQEVIVLGDGMNDISLFECFPYSYAPSNAEEEIKALAYKVVADCEEDGFAQAIDSIF